MARRPTADDAHVYMEICAALLTILGDREVTLTMDVLPVRPFSIWRRQTEDGWIVRLVFDDDNSRSEAKAP